MRVRPVLLALTCAGAAAGCPDRAEVVNQVGGAPHAQVDDARKQLERAEAKINKNLDQAAASTDNP